MIMSNILPDARRKGGRIIQMDEKASTQTVSLEHYQEFTISDYLKQPYSCSCNKTHRAAIREIILETGAIMKLPGLIRSNGFVKPFFLYDSTTYEIAGSLIDNILQGSGIVFSKYVLAEAEPVPDEKALASILIHYDPSCDLIIAVGSGTLNDLSRFISHKLKLPYIILATAPSMDGYASGVSPLIVNHTKTTFEAHAPFAILGDLNLLREAPGKMIAAGIGDILGKYNALCDWSLAHLILGEYHCPTLEGIVRKSLETVLRNMDGIKSRDPQAIHGIMEALVLSGIAMSFAGNSRPASGSEHHLAHYWEMRFLSQGKKPYLHGTFVGVATVAVLKAYELLKDASIDFKAARKKASAFSAGQWEADMIRYYGPAAPSVIRLEKESCKNAPDQVLARLAVIEDRWEDIRAIIALLPSADYIRNILLSLSAPASPVDIGIDRQTFLESFLAAKELRNRYALLQLLYDLGLLKELACRVWDYF